MKKLICISGLFLTLIGCGTTQKARLEARDKVIQQSGMMCDFVNEADYKDVDIELNIRMANKCNGSKPFSVSGYKRFNESQGFMYCCNVKEGVSSASLTNPLAEEKEKTTPSNKDKDKENK